jgi:hypothetical protein
MTGLNTAAVMQALADYLLVTGRFERVNQHEPKNTPVSGLNAALWANTIAPVQQYSGLSTTSARIEFTLRIYSGNAANGDEIDPHVIDAVDDIMSRISADFDVSGLVNHVDLLGETGAPLSAKTGYLPVDADNVLRIVDITIPVIINDVWEQDT